MSESCMRQCEVQGIYKPSDECIYLTERLRQLNLVN